jgi:AbrB family transcriptional regulator (stage V sporulation protein T)
VFSTYYLYNFYSRGIGGKYLMTATGIVRRIDDLGRIVVPKEIRRVLRIKEGDPMEIFTNRDGEILLKKYSPIGELREFAGSYAESLYQTTGHPVCITDRDSVVAAAGPKRREYDGKPLSAELEKLMERRESSHADAGEASFIKVTPDEAEDSCAQAIATIICSGDAVGAVVLSGKNRAKWQPEAAMQLVRTAAQFLGKQMEL